MPENKQDITTIVAAEFRSFGGGKQSSWGNPIAAALAGQPAQFAAGVDIAEVVERVCQLYDQIKKK